MSDQAEESAQPEKKAGMLGKLIVWAVIFVIGAGAGAAVPLLTFASSGSELNNGDPSVQRMDLPEAGDEIAFIEFGETVVNIDDPRYSRYITCSFSFQVAKTQEAGITKLVEDRRAILTNWLIAHLRDKKLEEVRGKFGHNMLRREIHGKFNELLFTDGIERIQDVLFKDLKVQ